MQDRQDPDQAPHVLRIGRQLQQRFGRRLHHQTIQRLLVAARKVPEFLGEREDHMVIRHRQQFPLALLEPGLGVAGMTLGATAVATGVIRIVLPPAFVALVQMTARRSSRARR